MKNFLILHLLMLGVHLASGRQIVEYDFEVTADVSAFTAEGGSTIVKDGTVSKSQDHSLLWSMLTGTDPILKLQLTSAVTGKDLRNGGLKFWMYRDSPTLSSNIVMQIIFKDTSTPSAAVPVKAFHNFDGWRAVWIAFREFGSSGTGLNQVNEIEFSFSASLSANDKLYIDLFRVTSSVSEPSRDKIVPNKRPLKPSIYSEKDFWHQTLKWSKFDVPEPTSMIDDVDTALKLADIDAIETRLDNWYADKSKGLHDDGTSGTRSDFENLRYQRWQGLLKTIDAATANYDSLTFSTLPQKIVGPPLFCRSSEYGNNAIGSRTKFGFVMAKILLPLAIEYNLRSRDKEVGDVVTKECPDLKSTDIAVKDKALENVAGENTELKDFLDNALPAPNFDCSNPADIDALKASIRNLNSERLRRINLLLDYVSNQGWADGSGVGSLDHVMNTNGAGFMHAMFLLRGELRKDTSKFKKDIKTMKWYNDFNEIYQTPGNYVFDGTTADRMRTILLYRLMIVLMMPTGSAGEKKRKVRDMRYLKQWIDHALKINKGLGGVIKPDYTGFHHKTFYGSAYAPHALHNAALMQYLLQGTRFQFDDPIKTNLRNALELMRIVAVKYSTPNSICGRFPNYNKAILAETTPAYAYISYVPGTTPTVDDPEMFLRLYDFNEPAIEKYLRQGRMTSAIYYLNSIGSLDIMQKVKNLASGITAEASPSGHWSKNFAALSIHRRNDWAVAAKGFKNYVWDFESGGKENVYGLFQSHGSLQISNDETALSSYDVNFGWDWTRIPGATTIDLPFDDIRIDKARNYNLEDIAGGVGLRGASRSTQQNGVFGMNFLQPDYVIKNSHAPLNAIDFRFRKSFFFLNHLIVCIGSDIHLSASTYFSQTTVFQDKLVSSSSIKIQGVTHDLATNYPDTMTPIVQGSHVDLEDTRGNTYRVGNPDNNQELHVTIQNQTSMEDDGRTPTSGRYATAWLKHTQGAGSSYVYAILINGGASGDLGKFTVTQRNSQAHVVKFNNLPAIGTTTTGYSVFSQNTNFMQGPLSDVNQPCMIMTEEIPGTPGTLHIALSNPTFTLEDDPVMMSRDTCTRSGLIKTNTPITSNDVGSYLLFCVESNTKEITVTLRDPVTSTEPTNVWVNDEDKTSNKAHYVTLNSAKTVITFKNLKNGFTTEAVFNI